MTIYNVLEVDKSGNKMLLVSCSDYSQSIVERLKLIFDNVESLERNDVDSYKRHFIIEQGNL